MKCILKRQEFEKDNVYIRDLSMYENAKRMKKGIENALVLDDVDISSFYEEKIKKEIDLLISIFEK